MGPDAAAEGHRGAGNGSVRGDPPPSGARRSAGDAYRGFRTPGRPPVAAYGALPGVRKPRVEATGPFRAAPGSLIATAGGVRGGGRALGCLAGRSRGAPRGSGRGGPDLEGRRSGPDRGAGGHAGGRSTSRRRVCDHPGVAGGVGEAYEAVRKTLTKPAASAGGPGVNCNALSRHRRGHSQRLPECCCGVRGDSWELEHI